MQCVAVFFIVHWLSRTRSATEIVVPARPLGPRVPQSDKIIFAGQTE